MLVSTGSPAERVGRDVVAFIYDDQAVLEEHDDQAVLRPNWRSSRWCGSPSRRWSWRSVASTMHERDLAGRRRALIDKRGALGGAHRLLSQAPNGPPG